jgi:hypothetical protein
MVETKLSKRAGWWWKWFYKPMIAIIVALVVFEIWLAFVYAGN